MKSRSAGRIGVFCASLHCMGFLATVLIIQISGDPQIALLWGYWAVIDFPVSLVYLVAGANYDTFCQQFQGTLVAHLIYLPHIIHGFLGLIWWYFLPKILLPKRFGGMWGKGSSHQPPEKN